MASPGGRGEESPIAMIPWRRVDADDLALFLRPLGAMLASGLDIRRALRIAADHSGSERIQKIVPDLLLVLEDGRELYIAMQRHTDIFDGFCIEMARQGEADGQLGENLLSAADYLESIVLGAPASTAGLPGTGPRASSRTVLSTVGSALVGSGLLLLPIGWDWRGAAGAAAAAALLWSGGCFLFSAWFAGRRMPRSDIRPKLPPKSRERREAETEGLVRNAVMEQAEDQSEADWLDDSIESIRPETGKN